MRLFHTDSATIFYKPYSRNPPGKPKIPNASATEDAAGRHVWPGGEVPGFKAEGLGFIGLVGYIGLTGFIGVFNIYKALGKVRGYLPYY